MKTDVYRKSCAQMFLAALFIITPKWKQPECPADEVITKCVTSTQWKIIQSEKGMKDQHKTQHE
jgi:hypothetical protein